MLRLTVMPTHCPLPLVQMGCKYKKAEPIIAPLSRNVTVPGAFDGETWAVKLIPPGTGVAASVVVVLVLAFIVCVSTAEVLPL